MQYARDVDYEENRILFYTNMRPALDRNYCVADICRYIVKCESIFLHDLVQ